MTLFWAIISERAWRYRNRQIGFQQTRKILYSKGNNQQSEDTTYRVWKYFLIISDKQLTHKEHNSIPRKQIGQLKNEKSWIDISHETNGQEAYKKYSASLVIRECKYKPQDPPPIIRMAFIQNMTLSVGEDVEKREHLHHWWECKLA
jgi:hypothetical protein